MTYDFFLKRIPFETPNRQNKSFYASVSVTWVRVYLSFQLRDRNGNFPITLLLTNVMRIWWYIKAIF